MVKWEITQETKSLPKLKNPLFVEGLPGIGNVGKIAVDFLVEELGAKKLYTFFSYNFPHSVFVGEDDLVSMPKIEIYYRKFASSTGRRDLLLLVGDIQPVDEVGCYTFTEEILRIVQQFGCSEMIMTGGIGLQEIPEKPRVYCTANDQQLFKEYTKKNLKVKKEIFGVVGPIIGVSGTLLGLGKKRGVKGVALLAETFGNQMHLGIKGAKEILRVFEKKFEYGLDIKRMTKEIVDLEKELMTKTQEWASEMKTVLQAGAKAKKRETGYIG